MELDKFLIIWFIVLFCFLFSIIFELVVKINHFIIFPILIFISFIILSIDEYLRSK